MTALPTAPAAGSAPTVDPMRAVAAYQQKVGDLTNEVVMRDAYIAELAETITALTAEIRDLRGQLGLPTEG
ncbi:hypothetical protein OG900_33360 [Streptomyces sp. NBC_00433]